MSSKKKGIYIRNKRIKHMSGPVSIHYLVPSDNHKYKNLPLVLLFGDVHGDFDNVCSYENDKKKSKTYAIYDEKFIKLIDIEDVHFFVEDVYIHDSEKKWVFSNPDPITSVFNIARNCYKRTNKCISKNIKWHYSDVRRVIDGDEKYEVLKSIENFHEILKDIYTADGIDETVSSSFNEFKEDFNSLIKKWLVSDSFVDFFTKENIYIKQEKKSELKLLNKLKTFYIKKEHKLYRNKGLKDFRHVVNHVIEILDFIDEFLFLTKYDPNQFNIDLSEFLSKASTLYRVFNKLCSFMVDIYVLQRSFKYNSKLNIFYFGDLHIHNMFKFLVESKLYKIEYTRESETKSLYNYDDDLDDDVMDDDDDDKDDFLMQLDNAVIRCITIDEHVSIPI
jgi:hypothetical protein